MQSADQETQEIFDTLPNKGTAFVEGVFFFFFFVEAVTAFKTYCTKKQNKHFEKHIFRFFVLKGNEAIDAYVTIY